VLSTVLAATAQPCRQSFRRYLPAAAIEQLNHNIRSAPLLGEPLQKRLLASEALCAAAHNSSAASEIAICQLVEQVLRATVGTDMCKRHLHAKENTAKKLSSKPAPKTPNLGNSVGYVQF
jgi:hypothetical protein